MNQVINNSVVTLTTNAYAGKAWVASIDGKDAKYGLSRSFWSKRDVTSSGNKYRDLQFVASVREGEIVEYFSQVSSGRTERGYWIVTKGQLVDVNHAQVIAAVA